MANIPKLPKRVEATSLEVVKSVNALHGTIKDLVRLQKSFFSAFTFLKKELTGKIEKAPSGRGYINIKTGKWASQEEFEAQEFLRQEKEKRKQSQKRKEAESEEQTPPTTPQDRSLTPLRLGVTTPDLMEDLIDGVWELVEEIKTPKPTPLRLPGPILDASYRVEERTLSPIRMRGDLATRPQPSVPQRIGRPPFIDAEYREIEDLLQLPSPSREKQKRARQPKGGKDHLGAIAKDIRTIRVTLKEIRTDVAALRKLAAKAQRVSKAEKDKAIREKKTIILKERRQKAAKPKLDEKKGLGYQLADFFGFTDLYKMFKPMIGIVESLLTGIFALIPRLVSALTPLMTGILKSLFGGPLGIIASIGFLINDFFKGLDIADALGISNVSGIIGSIFGGDLVGGMMSAFKNAGKWAIMGATIGSAVPGIGTLAGGIVGAALGAILGWIGGGQIGIWMEQLGNTIANWWDATVAELFDVKDVFANAKDKFKQIMNTTFSSIVGGILDFIGNLLSILADIEIPVMNLVPQALQKFIPDFVLESIPKTARPFGFLSGTVERLRTSAASVRETSATENTSLDKKIAERVSASEQRQQQLDITEATRAQRIQDATEELARLKAADAQGKKETTGVPSLTPAPTLKGQTLDAASRGIQAIKEQMGGGAAGAIVAPVTNNVVTTKGPTNNIVQGMPSTRSTESSWGRWQYKNYVPS